ncbi:nucleolar transcription factor 1 [Salmo trutta]|uniref:nucleolar transcription factor 1 n=1 Tax=Salmo trutta TaxID=8032 RepID=UPI0011319C1B|nr:nucleolar transcription factor 1-like [Salmo trutta]
MDFTEEEEMETSCEKQAWGREDLIKLLHGIKENIPKGDTSIYTKGERTLKWDKVAFGSYSPQMCHQKWKELSKKVRKIRSLAELVTEAEVAFENPFQGQNWRIHPDFPRRPTPPNSIFFRENHKTFEKQQPEMTTSELFKLISGKYSELPEHEKAKYIATFQKEKEMYEKSMRKLRKEYSGGKKVRRDYLKNMSGPLTPHGLWYRHERRIFLQANPDKKVDCIRQSIEQKTRWSKLPDKEKLKWINRSLEQQTQYEETVTDKEQQHILLEKRKSMQTSKLVAQKGNKNTFQGEPKKPPRWGHTVFYSEKMAELRAKSNHLSSRKCMAMVSPLWKKLAQKKQEHYQRIAQERAREYLVELRSWFNTMSTKEQAKYLDQNPNKLKILDNPEQGYMAKKGRTSTVTDKAQQHILLEKRKSMQTSKLVAQKGNKNTLQGEPKKPPRWGHTVFYSEKMAELRAKSNHLSSRKCMAMVSPLWKKLAQKKQEHYQRIAQERAREYQVELRSWFNTMSTKEQAKYLDQNPNKLKILDNPEQGYMAKKGRTSTVTDKAQQHILLEKRKSMQTSKLVAQKGNKNTLQGEPKKPPRWGHTVFYSEKMAELRAKSNHLSSRKCMAMVSPLWKKLAQKKQEHYQRIAQERAREYQVELRSWFNTMSTKEQAKYLDQNPNKLKILDNPEQGYMAKKGRTSDSEDHIDTSSDEDDSDEDDEHMMEKENWSGCSSISSTSEEDSDTE